MVGVLSLALSPACRPAPLSGKANDSGTEVPAGWAVVAPYDTGSTAAWCASSAREQWRVTLSPDSGTLRILPDSGWTDRQETAVPDGRLVGIDRGEFGGGVWWMAQSGRDSVLLTRENLHHFIRLPSGEVVGLVGLAHMGVDTGAAVGFRREGATWRAVHLLDLRGEPRAYTTLRADSLLILTPETLQLVRLPTHRLVLHRNALWPYLYATALVRDRAGTVYVGMRHAVARLTPVGAGFREEWLVPAACQTMRRIGDYECRCEHAPG